MVRILLVDDEEVLLDMIKYILEENPGFTVDTAISAEIALDFLHSYEYDIIISDYSMPAVTGIDLFKQFKLMNIKIPFILQTGQENENIALEALRSGVDFFLEKGREGPLQFLEFSQIVNLLISKQKIKQKMLQIEEILQSLLESQSDGIAYVNLENNIQVVNQSFLNITGNSQQRIKNMSFLEIIPKEWNDFDLNAIKRCVFTDGKSYECRRDYIRHDGSRLQISIRVMGVKNNLHEPVGMWLIFKDLLRE